VLIIRERIAWMLRVNRVFGSSERLARASSFATAFSGGCWPGTASESKVSRWETAAVRVPYQAMRRYEELLGLFPGLLTATADNIHAYYSTRRGSRNATAGNSGPGGMPTRHIEELVDKAGSSGVMTGQEWDELTREIAGRPNFYICPSAIWTTLAERLLQEQIVADRVPWAQRFSALDRLLNHPVAQQSAIAACASLAADRMNQVGIEVICAMDVTAHPDASHHVLAQLTRPTSDMTFYGALLACVRKLDRGHFTPGESTHLASAVVSLLGDPARHDDARMLAVSLLRRLPPDVPTAVAVKLRSMVAGDEALSRVAATGRLGTSGQATGFVYRVVAAAAARMPREGPWVYDETLARVVDEMLYDPVPDVRLEAAFLLHATPYRAPVAAALGTELSRCAAAADTNLTICILDALRLIGGQEQRPVVEQITLGAGIPAPVLVSAARNIGHLGGASDDRYWNRALARHGQPSAPWASPASGAILRGLVYGLGMACNDRMLSRVRDTPGMPTQARQAASWWLGQTQRTRQSAVL
jgi:hypothetical protein